MAADIEIIGLNNADTLHELAQATFANTEPGFQVDGVMRYDELKFVFSVLRGAAPPHVQNTYAFNDGYHSGEYHDRFPHARYDNGPHVDAGLKGLAVHHNISTTVPVILANSAEYVLHPEEYVDASRVLQDPRSNIRRGETTPGRLTIFSEGGYEGLLPTLHHFERSGSGLWTRYACSADSEGLKDTPVSRFKLRRVAKKALRQAELAHRDITEASS